MSVSTHQATGTTHVDTIAQARRKIRGRYRNRGMARLHAIHDFQQLAGQPSTLKNLHGQPVCGGDDDVAMQAGTYVCAWQRVGINACCM